MDKATRVVNCLAREGGFTLSFFAMASLCEVLIDTDNEALAIEVGRIAANEAWRIEDKYSRYDSKSLCSEINNKAGQVIEIDKETFNLFEFANQCYDMSEGAFDITSGILRKAWPFDGSDNVPSKKSVQAALQFVGWDKVSYSANSFVMKKGMEIDFGGLGKEYAVDRAVLLISQKTNAPFLVNYGGDLAVYGTREYDAPWQVGIEHPSFDSSQSTLVTLRTGAVATSGDANRFLLKNNHRYSHILNVKTGWPVINPPNSITVAAPQCIQAGFLATLALIQGVNAENFLKEQNILHWSIR
ncbi:FAD:protein FMN transferase [Colwellia sp. RSH04]|uniref:FAD:protein FMN transferase n=1 Tax=Colwellia sp. RSH04 TaxID=2305464 RepID=UPI000E5734DA|nr:FAD:protein FMN transferase [Colwellia sp. RSH04]RHW77212.1 FAD:protein FMN transferase [Colwellia sp. RSH04]